MSLDNIIKFGIIRDVPVPAPSPTRYWAEFEEDRIEFDLSDVLKDKCLYDAHPQFRSLFDYVANLLIHTDMTGEEYDAIVARRTLAERRAIEDRIRNPKSS